MGKHHIEVTSNKLEETMMSITEKQVLFNAVCATADTWVPSTVKEQFMTAVKLNEQVCVFHLISDAPYPVTVASDS